MKILRSDKGISLIEVVISMAVLSIGIFSLYSMQIGAMQGNAKSLLITESANTARGKIEELLGKDYNDSAFDLGTHTETVDHPITSINWIVTSWRTDGVSNDGDTLIDEFDERGVKTVQLTVNYIDGGSAKTSTIHFLKAEIF